MSASRTRKWTFADPVDRQVAFQNLSRAWSDKIEKWLERILLNEAKFMPRHPRQRQSCTIFIVLDPDPLFLFIDNSAKPHIIRVIKNYIDESGDYHTALVDAVDAMTGEILERIAVKDLNPFLKPTSTEVCLLR